MAEKARYWTWVGYPESMIDDWEDSIGEVLQLPYAYCIHDKDLTDEDEEKRKTHVHIMIVYGNTTTMNSVRNLFSKMRKDQDKEKVFVQSVQNVRYMYNYLIHDTDNAQKKNKYLYDPSERITGNDFDIGMYEQISKKEKQNKVVELLKILRDSGITDFATFVDYVVDNLDLEYFELLTEKSGFFERYIKGNFYRYNTKKIR